MFCKVFKHFSGFLGQVIIRYFQVAETSLNSRILYQERARPAAYNVVSD